ncbi:MAG: SUMF1/EgtB/PvdO family nonheme iron enzyme [Pseudomonadota bacterium]
MAASIGLFLANPTFAKAIDGESTPGGEGPLEEVLIPGGIQRIYSPELENQQSLRDLVEIEVRPFCMAVQELTIEEYLSCLRLGPCTVLRVSSEDTQLPINSLSYAEVQTFIEWYSDHHGLDYRLPSEAEWQSAVVPDYRNPIVG